MSLNESFDEESFINNEKVILITSLLNKLKIKLWEVKVGEQDLVSPVS
jgi:hypothetical protein